MKRDYQFDLLMSEKENNAALLKHDDQFNLLPVAPKQERFSEISTLSSREFEIMHLTLSGVSITEIALKIFLSPAGVKWRLSQIYNEFGVKNRLDLINKATTEGLHFVSRESGVKHSFSMGVNLQGHGKNSSKVGEK